MSSTTTTTTEPSCSENFGNKVDSSFASFFSKIGIFVGNRPKQTILLSILLAVICGVGFMRWETESRGEELWVPQDTTAEQEEIAFLSYYPRTARFNQIIVQSKQGSGGNVLTKGMIREAMLLHAKIESGKATIEDEGTFILTDLCPIAGGSCTNYNTNVTTLKPICQCLITSILRQWNYDITVLDNDDDWLTTLNNYGTQADLQAVLGNPIFDQDGNILSAEAFTISYFLQDQSIVQDGARTDPINEGWEEQVFLEIAEEEADKNLNIAYFATRSFGDEFGATISGDLTLVQISYFVAFFFLGATMGKIKCGTGSRWTMALGALFMVGLSTAAGFGISSLSGLFYGPVHSLLPFVLLGIGVDDAFVIVNAFNRERTKPRQQEDNDGITQRCSKSLARAGTSITVTSMTDLVAFAISSSSALPALASFCAYAAICIFFLWLFASTFFTAALVLDERRQRDNRRECLCCVTRNGELQEDGETFKEGFVSKYFRHYHAPAILSVPGKILVLTIFAGLLGFGIYGAMNLNVEDSGRNFVPEGSYLGDWIDASDEYFASQGTDLYIVFENSQDIYKYREELSNLKERVTGLSDKPPYITEPDSEESYRNVMDGLARYLEENGTGAIGGVELGDDNWPINEIDFITTMSLYANFTGPGAMYATDVSFGSDDNSVDAVRVKLEYVKLTKNHRGEEINDAEKAIDAMDATRDMVDSWDDLPQAFPYSDYFLTVEGFKIIRRELFQNVGLAILSVGIIVFFTVASPVTSILITMNVAFCIIEILGFMYALGIVIDSVSVINIVLAVGLSVDYSAHVGHCFMVKGGSDKNVRVTESLADIGAAVLSGATSTFLAVVVLLFSSSYVFEILSKQFALTVALGVLHGLVALPVMLSLLGPKPFSSAELPESESSEVVSSSSVVNKDQIASTAHASTEGNGAGYSSSDNDENVNNVDEDEEETA